MVVSKGLLVLAERFPDRLLVWCYDEAKKSLNVPEIVSLFHHEKMLMSYNPVSNYLPDAIGYADETVNINVNKRVTCPTWQMSGMVGGVAAVVLLSVKEHLKTDVDFDYFLTSAAKLLVTFGIFCYSEPKLLTSEAISFYNKEASDYTLFKFVKQHYRARWVFLLFLNLFLYERRILLLPFLNSFFYNKRKLEGKKLSALKVQSSKKVLTNKELDVIIPTIGRKTYLHDVLKDFSKQTLLPKKIIIVEQNPETGSTSELDYLDNEHWPFSIEHIFIHQAGVCNARNLALSKTESEWVFLADDDNRFESDLLEKVFDNIETYGVEAVTTSYLQKGERMINNCPIQWGTFGAGNSFVKRAYLEKVSFNMAMEFGYGEDADFGMQIRNQGIDVIYFPQPEILHLKAPVGGFRTKPVLAWHKDAIQPKPSPTVMLFRLLHHTPEQLLGYKTTLFYKHYKHQNIKKPIKYIRFVNKQWSRSVHWANNLKNNSI
ncbi:glycosyl transferase [Flavobacterium enshiense DK69]|nr:glycosyl transferase [Flavobacterium enshiense DK69]